MIEMHRVCAWKWPLAHVTVCLPPRPSTMQANSQRPNGRRGVISTLNVTIEALNLAKEICSITPAKAAFGSVVALLTMIEVCFLLSLTMELLVHVSPGVEGQ